MNLSNRYRLLVLATLALLRSLNALAQTPRFNDFKAGSLFHGKPTPVRLKGNAMATMYRTRISEVYKAEGLNFAGHYCLVWWGCGSDCQHAAIVDLQTGKVYDGPTAGSLFQLKPTSNLLILNPDKMHNCAFCKPEYWLWNDHKKLFTHIK
jgi:hypothetical protein